MSAYSVGQSKVRRWRGCRQAYHYRYEEEIVRKRVRRPFMFGKIVHRMIEEKAQGGDPFSVLRGIEIDKLPIFTAEKEMYGEIVEDIGTIMTDYFDFHADGLRFLPVRDEEGELRFAEHEFAVPLEELVPKSDRARVQGIVFKGQVDGIGKTPNQLRWLVEHKTFDKLPSEDERWRNVQSVVYVRVVKHLGWMPSVDGTCWNYIMSKAPKVPELLKSGERLKAKRIVTLPSVVRATLAQHGLSEKLEAHRKLLERAEQSRRDYFRRIYTPISPVVAERIFSGFVDTAVEMRDRRDSRDKNIGQHCSWCDYEPLCRAELTGGDVDFVKQGEFEHEDPEGYRRSARDRSEAPGVAADQKTRGTRSPKLRVLRPQRHREDYRVQDVSRPQAPARRQGCG